MTPKAPKQKACKNCKTKFTPMSSWANACSPLCGLEIARAKRIKAEQAAKVKERQADRVTREKQKTRGQWVAEAKIAIQRFRRLEELAKGSGCISCLRTQQEVMGTDGWKPGGAWDGGHFLSKGARPELALEPLNIWLQCKSCNAGGGKYARKGYTVNAAFEANLIAKEGAELVDWLNGPHEPKHYSTDDLKAIKATYAAKTRELLKAKTE